jgi:hypothetical protein
MRCKTLFFLLILLCSVSTRAQYRAGIRGVVLDPQGAVIEGATITLTNLETSKTNQATSDAGGVYNFLALPPGHYKIEAEKPGFKKKTLDNLDVAGEQTQGMNLTLEVGDVSATVTVSGDTVPVLDTETGNISGTLSSMAEVAVPRIPPAAKGQEEPQPLAVSFKRKTRYR